VADGVGYVWGRGTSGVLDVLVPTRLALKEPLKTVILAGDGLVCLTVAVRLFVPHRFTRLLNPSFVRQGKVLQYSWQNAIGGQQPDPLDAVDTESLHLYLLRSGVSQISASGSHCLAIITGTADLALKHALEGSLDELDVLLQYVLPNSLTRLRKLNFC